MAGVEEVQNPDPEKYIVLEPAFPGDGNDTSGYVGVDPIYQNYANESEKPFADEVSAEDEGESSAEEEAPKEETPEEPPAKPVKPSAAKS